MPRTLKSSHNINWKDLKSQFPSICSVFYESLRFIQFKTEIRRLVLKIVFSVGCMQIQKGVIRYDIF